MIWHQRFGRSMLIVSWAHIIGFGLIVAPDACSISATFGGLSIMFFWRVPDAPPNKI